MAASSGPDLVRMQAISKSFPGVQALDDCHFELRAGEVHAEVGVVVHDQTSRTGIDRRDGFVNQMKSKHPQVNIVDIQYGGGDQLKSIDLAKAMMQAHPNLKGFFGDQ